MPQASLEMPVLSFEGSEERKKVQPTRTDAQTKSTASEFSREKLLFSEAMTFGQQKRHR